MNRKCHITMAESIWELMHFKHGIVLDRDTFVYGNTKPDRTLAFFFTRHTIQDTFAMVVKEIYALANFNRNPSFSFKEFSFRLGLLCHYITDYFCFPHNSVFQGNLREHMRYEKEQVEERVRYLYGTKLAAYMDAKEHCMDPGALSLQILEYHRDYIAQSQHTVENDFHCALQMCCRLVGSLCSMNTIQTQVLAPAYVTVRR